MDNRNPQRSTAGANRLRTRVAPLPGPAIGSRVSDHGICGFGRIQDRVARRDAARRRSGIGGQYGRVLPKGSALLVRVRLPGRKSPFGDRSTRRASDSVGRAGRFKTDAPSHGSTSGDIFIRTLIILPFCQVFRARTASTDRSGDPLAPSRRPHGRPGLPETPVFRQDPVYEREIALRTPDYAAPAVRDPRETPRNGQRGRTSKGATPRPRAMASRFRTPDGRAYPRTPSPPAERAASAASAFTLARPISVHSGSSSGMDPAFLVKNSFRQL